MPGVEIHANFVEMFLQNDFLVKFNYIYYLLISLVITLTLFALFYWLKPVLSGVVTFGLITISLVISFILFSEMNVLIPIFQIPILLVGIYIVSLILNYIRTLKERKYIKKAFTHYMASDLVEELLKNPKSLKYGGHQKEISVLFSDIRSFTTYTESHSPAETVEILSEYLTAMVDIIIKHKGTLDKFVGDEIMALFGTPVSLENHALNACKVALDMREVLTKLQHKWESNGIQPFEIGIGVNSGQAIVGNLGSEQIFDYTAIGDTINLGARLEAINKEYPTKNKIIISEFTLELVKDYVIVRYLDEVKVKGKTKAVKIFALEGLK
jgi:adenylate cyclase